MTKEQVISRSKRRTDKDGLVELKLAHQTIVTMGPLVLLLVLFLAMQSGDSYDSSSVRAVRRVRANLEPTPS